MTEAIIVALITLIGTIISVLVTSRSTQTKMTNELQTQNAVQNQKIDQLTKDIADTKSLLTTKIEDAAKLNDIKFNSIHDKQQEMAEDIKEHNNYAKQLPEIRGKLDLIVERQEVANKRINDLENFQKETNNWLINNK